MSLYLLLSLLPAVAATLTGALALYSWQRRETPGARAFSLFAAAIFVWCFLAVVEYLSQSARPRIAFGLLQYLGIAYAPVFWLVFTLRYTHRDGWLTRRTLALLAALPTATLVLALTTPWHGLVWREAVFTPGPVPDLAIAHGWWFSMVMLPYSYLAYLAGVGVLLRAFFSDSGVYRKQIAMLLAAFVFPFVGNLIYNVAGLTLLGLDPTPIGLAASSVLLSVGMFGTGFMRTAPVSYRTVFLNTAEAVLLLSADDRVLDVNPAALERHALSRRDTIGRPLLEVAPWLGPALADGDAASERTTRLALPAPGPLNAGDTRLVDVKLRPLHSGGGSRVGRAVILHDVTLEAQQRAALERFAYYDGLTELPNRRQLRAVAETALGPEGRERWPLAVLYIDLDGFKAINDSWGHEVGDAALVRVAGCLREVVGSSGTVARIGGDEFAALLERTDDAAIRQVQRQLLERFDEPFDIAGLELRVQASIGCAVFPGDGETLADLLRHADRAMYRAKHSRQASSPTRAQRAN